MEWLYGRQVVATALGAGVRRRPSRLAGTPAALHALGARVPGGLDVETVDERELERLTRSGEHQGVAVLVGDYPYVRAHDLLGADLLIVLDEISDPHNLGAVARSALAAGAAGLVVPRHRAAHVTPAAVKASAGTLELLPVAVVPNVVAFLKQAKKAGLWVYGAAGDVSCSYVELDLCDRSVLVFGSEGRGLRPLVARACDALATIPMEPQVQSLNVSVAAAVFLFEARRQRAAAAAPPGGVP